MGEGTARHSTDDGIRHMVKGIGYRLQPPPPPPARCGVVWCGMVCRRRCYQKAMAGMSTHGCR